MQAYTPLVAEHNVIQRMIEVIKKLIEGMRESKEESQASLDNVIDFLCMYVERCHHAKEEGIFFRYCEKNGIHGTDKKIMEELIEEHVFIMRTVGELIDVWHKHVDDYRSAREILETKLEMLTTYCPEHMRKENEMFFPRAMKYFSHEEQYFMLREFWKFNDKIVFEKYHAILDRLEALTAVTSYPPIRLFHSL